MILVYELQPPRENCLFLQIYGMEIAVGKPMRGTRYPGQAERLLKNGLPGLTYLPLDKKILMNVMMQDSGRDAQVRFRGREAARMLELLLQTGRAYTWANPDRPLRPAKALRAEASWRVSPSQIQPALKPPEGLLLLPARPPMALNPETSECHPLQSGNSEEVTWAWLSTPPMALEAAPAFYQSLLTRHPAATLPAPPSVELRRMEDVAPVPRLRVRKLPSGFSLQLGFLYGDQDIDASSPAKHLRFFEDGHLIECDRNPAAELHAHRTLDERGFSYGVVRSGDLFAARREQEAWSCSERLSWTDCFQKHLPELEAEGWRILYDPGAEPLLPADADWYADVTDSRRGWLGFEQGVRVGDTRLNLLPFLHQFLRERVREPLDSIRAYLQTHDVPVTHEDRIIVIEGARFLRMVEQLFELFGEEALDAKNLLRVNPLRAAELALETDSVWRPPPELLETVRNLKGALTVEPMRPPACFGAELRPYQEQGMAWLNFLHETRMGGILADDMGLGKTVQVLALLAHRRALRPDEPPVLIVSPTSVLPNWRREAKKFTPHLKVHVQHGAERHGARGHIEKADLVLTTYPLLWRDETAYEKIRFSTLILDEAQAVKNPKARAHRAAAAIQAEVKLCLTGTPCENHLGDLWSLFNIVQPGFLGSETEFRRGYRKPIEQEGCPVIRRSLQNRIRPLLLRRTKETVALDLPPKTEIIVPIHLSDTQSDLYQVLRMAMSEKIQEEMARKGLERSHIMVLDALLKLRQICCDPRLRDPRRIYELPADSAKLTYLLDMLPELIEEGRRILLFSQFTSMLDLIKPELKKLKIPYVEIRGDTRDRDTPVRRFEAGEVPLFLISLKAGGSGLNLVAADTVIHYDPWWNPAVEAQATDRAHRIGQDKPVFVYKLVTENTIENVILDMQNEKRDLAGLLEAGDGSGVRFSESDLQRLLAPLPAG